MKQNEGPDTTTKFVDLVREKFGVIMVNTDKVSRAVFGTSTGKGLVGGVGEEASAEVILAKYDEFNGCIRKDGFKVKNGTFVESKTKKPVVNPKIILLIKVNGEYAEQEENAPESLEIKIAKRQAKAKKVKEDEE